MDELDHIIQEILVNHNSFSNLYFLLRDKLIEYRELHSDILNRMFELGYLQNKSDDNLKLTVKGFLASLQANSLSRKNDFIERVRLRKKQRKYIKPIIDYFLETMHEGLFRKEVLDKMNNIEFVSELYAEFYPLILLEFPKYLILNFEKLLLYEFSSIDLNKKQVYLFEYKLNWDPVYIFDNYDLQMWTVKYIEIPLTELCRFEGIDKTTFEKRKENYIQKRLNYFATKNVTQKEYENYKDPEPVSLKEKFKDNKDAKYIEDIFFYTRKFFISDIYHSGEPIFRLLRVVIEPLSQITEPAFSFFSIDGNGNGKEFKIYNKIVENIDSFIGKTTDLFCYQITFNQFNFSQQLPEKIHIFYKDIEEVKENMVFEKINKFLDSYLKRHQYYIIGHNYGEYDNAFEFDWTK